MLFLYLLLMLLDPPALILFLFLLIVLPVLLGFPNYISSLLLYVNEQALYGELEEPFLNIHTMKALMHISKGI